MFSGFYTAASGMLTQQKILNTQANNLANLKTPGFKGERVVTTTFEQEFLNRLENGRYTPVGHGAPMVLAEDVRTQYDSSVLEQTARELDLAIDGEGFFTIHTSDDRDMLTRNGSFAIDEEGYLVLPGLGRVQGYKGDIRVENNKFLVSDDGVVISENGREIDSLLISVPAEETKLEKFPNGMYAADKTGLTDDGLEFIDRPRVKQGFLERSNVDMNRELTAMIETQRNFQSCNNALKIIDTMNQKTASTLGSI